MQPQKKEEAFKKMFLCQTHKNGNLMNGLSTFSGSTPLCAGLQENKCRPAVCCRCSALSLWWKCENHWTRGGVYIQMRLTTTHIVSGGRGCRLFWGMLEWWHKIKWAMKGKERWMQHFTDASTLRCINLVKGRGGQAGRTKAKRGHVMAALLPLSLTRLYHHLLDWVAAGQALINAAGLCYYVHGSSFPHSCT